MMQARGQQVSQNAVLLNHLNLALAAVHVPEPGDALGLHLLYLYTYLPHLQSHLL